jgi:hypothetical protein
MAKPIDATGTYSSKKRKASFHLTVGRYEYRFRVDEVWHNDPNTHERVENPFGSQNCLRIVS